MVNTRSQLARNNSVNMNGMDGNSDAESENSLPEILTSDQINQFHNGDLLNDRNTNERHTVNQRFSEMNKKSSEVTNLVLALTEKISSSNREENELNTVPIGHETRSDNRAKDTSYSQISLLPKWQRKDQAALFCTLMI